MIGLMTTGLLLTSWKSLSAEALVTRPLSAPGFGRYPNTLTMGLKDWSVNSASWLATSDPRTRARFALKFSACIFCQTRSLLWRRVNLTLGCAMPKAINTSWTSLKSSLQCFGFLYSCLLTGASLKRSNAVTTVPTPRWDGLVDVTCPEWSMP